MLSHQRRVSSPHLEWIQLSLHPPDFPPALLTRDLQRNDWKTNAGSTFPFRFWVLTPSLMPWALLVNTLPVTTYFPHWLYILPHHTKLRVSSALSYFSFDLVTALHTTPSAWAILITVIFLLQTSHNNSVLISL